jgi:tRNA-specific 2-thiouridylase
VKNTYQTILKNTPLKKRKELSIYVGLSGGIDSSITAYKLKKDGFKVTGVYMQCFSSNDPKCRAKTDRADAVKVAKFINIPIEVWDLEKEYKNLVIKYFFEGYKKGLTPNPDILCNSQIKFGLFLQKALEKGANFVATGHYAQIYDLGSHKFKIQNPKNKDSYFIASGSDTNKDQSYFLCDVNPKVLGKIIFPLGNTLKVENRKLANQIKLPVASKKDSTGICFLEGINVNKFLKTQIKEKQGVVKNLAGQKVGTHKGVWFYTIGQRHGFEINKYLGTPSYVIRKNAKSNTLYIGEKKDLLQKKLKIKNEELRINFQKLNKIVSKGNVFVRIRNLGAFYKVNQIESKNTLISLTTQKPISAVASGQFAVLYLKLEKRGKIIIAHGTIS